jgi:hypothetical protein
MPWYDDGPCCGKKKVGGKKNKELYIVGRKGDTEGKKSRE